MKPFSNELKAFSREAVLWGQLSHSNLLPFYGIYRLEDTHRRICLVSPWMENGNVNDFLEKEPDFPRISLVRPKVQLLSISKTVSRFRISLLG